MAVPPPTVHLANGPEMRTMVTRPADDTEPGGGSGGFSVAYGRDETPFPVYLTGFLSAVFFAGAIATGSPIMVGLGLAAGAFAYYNFPLTETGRRVIGANQYGIFIAGFGIVRWRAIRQIELVAIAVRADTFHEVQIGLSQPLTSALIADWRKVPWWRRGMRLPWKMSYDNVVRVKVDPLDRTPDDIHRTLVRMWRFYRS
jgi:hypothetical protein